MQTILNADPVAYRLLPPRVVEKTINEILELEEVKEALTPRERAIFTQLSLVQNVALRAWKDNTSKCWKPSLDRFIEDKNHFSSNDYFKLFWVDVFSDNGFHLSRRKYLAHKKTPAYVEWRNQEIAKIICQLFLKALYPIENIFIEPVRTPSRYTGERYEVEKLIRKEPEAISKIPSNLLDRVAEIPCPPHFSTALWFQLFVSKTNALTIPNLKPDHKKRAQIVGLMLDARNNCYHIIDKCFLTVDVSSYETLRKIREHVKALFEVLYQEHERERNKLEDYCQQLCNDRVINFDELNILQDQIAEVFEVKTSSIMV